MADPIRAGIIGVDTSHVRAFTESWHKPDSPAHAPGVRVVAAYPSFSPDVESSASRVEGFKKVLSEQFGVKMVGSIAELAGQVDAILIESVDGRRHLPELRALVESKQAAGKPVFIDKPMAASLADAREIVKLSREHDIPCFSSSSLRFHSNLQKFLADEKSLGKVQGCDAFSSAHLEKTNPGLFWYGIHGVEILYTVMGRGCRSVRCTSAADVDLAVGVWKDGRIGTMRGVRGNQHADYGAFILCEKGYRHVPNDPKASVYTGLLREITKFFQTRKSPVPLEDTLEICAFCQAAWDSSQNGCCDVKIEPT